MTRPLTGAALAAREKRTLLDRAAKATARGADPAHVAALLVEAEDAYPTRNPEPPRPEILAAALVTPCPAFVPESWLLDPPMVVTRFTRFSRALKDYPADVPR